jgi:hypothetical protein
MAKNKGKGFEDAVRESLEKIQDVSVDRIPDQVTKYKGSTNICDFIAYKHPTLFYIECKSVQGNTLSIHSIPKRGKDGKLHGFYGNIRDNQWEGLLEKSKIKGVVAGVLCWWIDHDVTLFLPIDLLQDLYEADCKSVRYDVAYDASVPIVELKGEKKRVYFDYDMTPLLKLKH